MIQIPTGQHQLLHSIMSHSSFQAISSAFSIIQQAHGNLPTADLPFVELQVMQIENRKQSDQIRLQKLEASIEKLEEMISCVEQHRYLIGNQLKWAKIQSQKIMQAKEDIEEEIQIINSQTASGLSKRPKQNSQSSEELKQVLAYYCCKNSFPKNKTEALMLVNQIEGKIQQLQISRTASFHINS